MTLGAPPLNSGRGLPLHSALWPRYLERKWRDYFGPGRVPAFRVDAPPLPQELPQTAAWARRSLLHAYLYQPTWITVANARLKGLWKDVPVFANDLSALSWQ